MTKVIFDANAIDRLIDKLEVENSAFDKQKPKGKTDNAITQEQVTAIADLPDEQKEERFQGLLRICNEQLYLEGGLTEFFSRTSDLYEYHTTYVVLEEIANIKNTNEDQRNKRINDFLIICSMRPQVHPAAVFALGRSRLGMCYAGSQEDCEAYKELKGKNAKPKNHANDSMIGVVAKDGDMIVVTDDEHFKTKLNGQQIPYMTFDAWLDSLSRKAR